jgi:hypothetical protein
MKKIVLPMIGYWSNGCPFFEIKGQPGLIFHIYKQLSVYHIKYYHLLVRHGTSLAKVIRFIPRH